MSIIAYPLEATKYTAEDVQSYLSTRKSGVYSDEITFTPKGMTVTVSPFLAWFNYARFKGCSVAVTEPETLTFSPADAVFDRIDRIVLRVDLTLNKAYFKIVKGVARSSPVPPDISKTEVINDISPVYVRIRAGATEITPADITSTILDERVCGIMRDGVRGIPTAQLQVQVEELLIRLHEAIDGVKDGSAFMFGDIYDPEGKTKPVAFKDETLPIDGSVPITGEELFISGGLGSVYADDWGTNIMNYSPNRLNKRGIVVRSKSSLPGVEDSVLLLNWGDGMSTQYKIFGEHNKPSGTYTGNGSAASRKIDIGNIGSVGRALLIMGNAKSTIVTHNGSFTVANTGVAGGISRDEVYFANGKLIISSTNPAINLNGVNYNYQVL